LRYTRSWHEISDCNGKLKGLEFSIIILSMHQHKNLYLMFNLENKPEKGV